MARKATGTVFQSRGVWYARLLVDGQRRAFKLDATTESAARARLAVLTKLAAQLTGAGHAARADAFVAEAATAGADDLAAVLRMATRLCMGEVVPTQSACGKGDTVASLAVRWTSGDLSREYPDHVRPLKKAAACQGLIDKHVSPQIGSTPIQDVTIEHLEKVTRAYQGEASSRRRVGTLVSRILAIAVYPLKLIKVSPVPRGFFRTTGAKCDKAKVYLYPDEDRKLISCVTIPLMMRLFYGFLSREGMRASEAEALLWRDVDLERGAVTLDANKTDDPRAWAMSPGVVRALRAWKALRAEQGLAEADHPIFVFDERAPSHRASKFRAHLRAAGVDRAVLFERTPARRPIRCHDLRATLVTISLANGKTEAWIADRTGHRSSEMINRYRRAARTVAELGLGELVQLDEGIPEIVDGRIVSANGSTIARPKILQDTKGRGRKARADIKPAPLVSNSCNAHGHKKAPLSAKNRGKQGRAAAKRGLSPEPLTIREGSAADSIGVRGVQLPFAMPPVNDVSALSLAAGWACRLVAGDEMRASA